MTALAYDSTLVRTVEAQASDVALIQLGEAVNAGQAIQKASDNLWYLADGNGSGVPLTFGAYAVQNGGANDRILSQRGGTIYLGVDTEEGMLYVLSSTPGGTENVVEALVTSGLEVTLIGYGDDAGNLVIKRVETGFTIA